MGQLVYHNAYYTTLPTFGQPVFDSRFTCAKKHHCDKFVMIAGLCPVNHFAW